MRLIPALLITLFSTAPALAAGPEKVATLDRTLWPAAITDQAGFNRASEAEILSFVRVMHSTALQTEADIRNLTGLEQINTTSVQQWADKTRNRLLHSYAQACAQCTDARNWQSMTVRAQREWPAELTDWAAASDKFYRRYLYEQVRLAALFPRITSEIDTLSAQQEVTGFELTDGQFLLTYDDGPAADNKGENRTQKLADALRQDDIHAFFFVLGARLQQQQPDKNWYLQQCLGSHGYEHKSHQKWDNWKGSLNDTRTLLSTYQPGPFWMRPPYGQRTLEMVNELASQQEKIMLWNIDSQDWNRKLTDQQVQDRVLTLMLLWRRGIILYHDIHGRALQNLPALNQFVKATDQQWLDCRTLAASLQSQS